MNKSTLKDVSELITKGTTPSSLGCEFVSEGINFIKSESISNSKYLNSSIYEHIDTETDKKLKRSRIKEGDLLFSIAGAYLGKIAIVQRKDIPANTNQAVGIVRLNKDKVDVDYVYYYFSQRNINAYINKLSSQSSQPNLNLDLLGKLELDLKDIDEQRKIASVLSALDSKIELNNLINNELEAISKTIYDYWFVQFDFPDKNGRPYKACLGKMSFNNELNREVPENWEITKMKSKIKIGSGFPFDSSTYLKKGKYKIITIKNVQELRIETTKVDYIDKTPENISDFCKLKIGDILMSLTGNVGRICLVPENNLLLNQRVGKILCNDMYRNFAYLFFQREEERLRLEKIATGSSQKNLSPADAVDNYTFFPPEKILSEFNSIIQPKIEKMILNIQENQKLIELRDWLIPMLMNGQVKIQ
ncbi:restriction endonuclease subunit S [Aquirufa sp. TARAVU-A1A]